MPPLMSVATKNDISALTGILFETTLESEWGRIQFGQIEPHAWHKFLKAGLTAAIVYADPPCTIMKMTDDQTGELIGFVELVFPETEAKKVQAQSPQTVKPPGFNAAAIHEYFSRMVVVRKRVVAERPYFHVADLAVKALHRRQGVGSSLMRWAIEYTRSQNGMIYLESTPAGVPVYEKVGFTAKDRFGLELQPYGGNGYYEEVAMLWQPNGPADDNTL